MHAPADTHPRTHAGPAHPHRGRALPQAWTDPHPAPRRAPPPGAGVGVVGPALIIPVQVDLPLQSCVLELPRCFPQGSENKELCKRERGELLVCQRLLGWGWCQEWSELPPSPAPAPPAPLQVSRCGVEGGAPAPSLGESRGADSRNSPCAGAVLPTGPCGGCEEHCRTKSWYLR